MPIKRLQYSVQEHDDKSTVLLTVLFFYHHFAAGKFYIPFPILILGGGAYAYLLSPWHFALYTYFAYPTFYLRQHKII